MWEINPLDLVPSRGTWLGQGRHNRFGGAISGGSFGPAGNRVFVAAGTEFPSTTNNPFTFLNHVVLPDDQEPFGDYSYEGTCQTAGNFGGIDQTGEAWRVFVRAEGGNDTSDSSVQINSSIDDNIFERWYYSIYLYATDGGTPQNPLNPKTRLDQNINITDTAISLGTGEIAAVGFASPGDVNPVNAVQDEHGGGGGLGDGAVMVAQQPFLLGLANSTFTGKISAGMLVTAFGAKIGPKNFVFSEITPEGTLQDNVEGVEVLVIREDGTQLMAKVLNASFNQTTFVMPN